ncbi:hypothetical protein [Salinimicrobium xinjiangense]|uniref:hypothetical protein n=1 Tax=Salinimicrobium xinjiangense TaxID=438596 RepID=UPI000417C38E|nr:hypothetical protein [Salinimicrobium xinjiangense]
MKALNFVLIVIFPAVLFAQKKPVPAEIQIKTATLAAPEELRESTKVYGYNDKGELVVLREGTNYLVCIADDPSKKGISVSCYSEKLEPFMARGRQLTEEGKPEMERRDIRRQEAEDGSLQLPDAPAMTYILSGSEENYNPQTGELKDGHFRYVIYIPYATAESTGLPEKPFTPGMPWIMDPGTHRAHIMITPPKN